MGVTDLFIMCLLILMSFLVFRPDEIDLQLPQVEKAEQTVIIPANEPKIKFREKTVSSLGSGPVFFKKPKKKMTAAQFLKKREDS